MKRLSRRNGEVWLLPENENYRPIDGREATLLGKVTAVVWSITERKRDGTAVSFERQGCFARFPLPEMAKTEIFHKKAGQTV